MAGNDLERLIRIIVEEVTAAQASAAPVRCACHAVLFECCPDRLRGVIEAGASRIGLHAAGGGAAGVAGMIDHTLLKPDASRAEVETLCREAAEYHFASVCVNPTWVATCARLLHASPVKVCSVVGFPLGATTPDVKHYETRRALFDGAREIDMVINVGALKSGDLRVVERVRRRVAISELDLSRQRPPRQGYDLILCRNVVIYFDRATQERLFQLFAEVLTPGGYLVLGKVETLFGSARERLQLVDPRERIYRRPA